MNILEQFKVIPIDYATLLTTFVNYKSPKDKISVLVKHGDLIRLKKGLFVVAPKIHKQSLSKELIANHIYGLSYLSVESALSFYGMIPERVHSTRSVTLKRTKQFSTSIGVFDYVTIPTNYFNIGIRQEFINNQYAFLIASPEKAICDMIISSPGLRLQSVKAMQKYLEEDLRIDFSNLESYDMEIIKKCIATGRKKTELRQLYKFLLR
jgi:predicted transcriptional regulator of viral defense system